MPVVARLRVRCCCTLGFVLTCIGARAQSVNATMVGTIFDTSSAAIPQAKVTVTNKGTNVARTVTGNERGDYTITNLAPGFYQLVAEHEGFRRTVVGEIELLVNQTARLDLVLQVGAVSETVEVSSAGQLV